jgi:hypothetical protein
VTARDAQHGEVADVVGHLVGHHGERRHEAQPRIRGKRRGDQDAVTEAMNTVPREHGPTA